MTLPTTCPSCEGPAAESQHPCPYALDFSEYADETCICCEKCTKLCAQEENRENL